MSGFDTDGVFDPVAGAENAFAGQVIASATWNAINLAYSTALTQLGEGRIVKAARIETAAGPFTILATDLLLVLNKAAPSATTLNLPTLASRNGTPLYIIDYKGNAGDVTINGSGSEKIMGVSPWTITSGGSLGTGGSLLLIPIAGVGWVVCGQ